MTYEPKIGANRILPVTFPVISFNCACTSAIYLKKTLCYEVVVKRQVLCLQKGMALTLHFAKGG